MKFFIALSLLLAVGLNQVRSDILDDAGSIANDLIEEIVGVHPEQNYALKGIVKRSLDSLGSTLLPQVEATIISNCRDDGHDDTANDLQDAYDDLKRCLRKKKIFKVTKDEFLSHLDSCSQDAVRKTRKCLPENQKYFPDFILALAKSVVSFMYDDFDLLRVDVAACLPFLNRYTAQRSYVKCLTDTSRRTQDTSEIPTSKASFCQKFIPASYCFTNMIKDNCDQTSNLNRFREDYINAMKKPCDDKETS